MTNNLNFPNPEDYNEAYYVILEYLPECSCYFPQIILQEDYC
ncbi:hypothetical protein [Nostoc sp.]